MCGRDPEAGVVILYERHRALAATLFVVVRHLRPSISLSANMGCRRRHHKLSEGPEALVDRIDVPSFGHSEPTAAPAA
jgi:hypothetical protein